MSSCLNYVWTQSKHAGLRSALSSCEVLVPSSVNSVTLSVTEGGPTQGPIISSWDGAAEVPVGILPPALGTLSPLVPGFSALDV